MRYFASARAQSGYLVEQQVAVVVEVANDGNRDAQPVEPLDDGGHRRGRRLVVDRHPDQLAAGAREIGRLLDRGGTSAVSVLVIDWTTIG